MSEAVRNSPIPAGWYPDPHGLPQQRWWSGNQWTGTVAPIAPLAAPTPLSSLPGPSVRPHGQHALDATSSATTEFPSRRALRQAGADLTTGEMALPTDSGTLNLGPTNGVTADLGPNLTAGSMAAAENPADPILSGPTLAAFGAPSATPAVYSAPVAAHALGVPAAVPTAAAVPAAAVPASAVPAAAPAAVAPVSAPVSGPVSAAVASAPTAVSPAVPDPAAAYPLAGLASPALANAAYPAAAPQPTPPPFNQALFAAPASAPASAPRADASTALPFLAPAAPKPATSAPFALTPTGAARTGSAPAASVTSAAEAPSIPGWHPAPVSAATTPTFAIAPAAVPFTPTPAAVNSAATPAENVHDMPYQPFGMIPKITSGVVGPPDRINTAAVWLIVIMPLLMVATGVVVVLQLGDFYTRFMQGGLLFIFALATIGLAIRDRRDLADSGHLKTASPAWVLLTPLGYLIARAVEVRRQAGRSGGALVVWLLIVAAIVAAAFLLPEWFTLLISAAAVI